MDLNKKHINFNSYSVIGPRQRHQIRVSIDPPPHPHPHGSSAVIRAATRAAMVVVVVGWVVGRWGVGWGGSGVKVWSRVPLARTNYTIEIKINVLICIFLLRSIKKSILLVHL